MNYRLNDEVVINEEHQQENYSDMEGHDEVLVITHIHENFPLIV